MCPRENADVRGNASDETVLGITLYKFLHPVISVASAISGIGLLALVANSICAALLLKHRHGDLNMNSVWLCSLNDLVSNMAVILAPPPSADIHDSGSRQSGRRKRAKSLLSYRGHTMRLCRIDRRRLRETHLRVRRNGRAIDFRPFFGIGNCYT